MGSIIKVANKQDLPPGRAMSVSVGNKRVALFNIDGKYYAMDDECTHAGGNLSEGEIEGHIVTCPWHGATFDITTGAVLTAPAFDNVNSYKVQMDGEDIKLEIP